MRNILEIIGFISLCGICFFYISLLIVWIKELIEKIRIRYIHNHRFDKPPTAECYCFDCEKWDRETGRCYGFEYQYTADSWFCWKASPRKEE